MKLNWKKIQTANWYRQESAYKTYFLSGPAIAVMEQMKAGQNFICRFGKHDFQMFYDQAYCLRLAQKELAKLYKNKNYLKQVYGRWQHKNKKLLAAIEYIRQLHIQTLNNRDLIFWNKKLGNLAYAFWLQPIFIDIFDSNAEILIQRELNQANINLSPRENEQLLKSPALSQNQSLQKDLAELVTGKKLNPQTRRAVLNRYYYLKSSYFTGQPFSAKDLTREIKHLAGQERELFQQLRTYPRAAKLAKAAIYGQHKFSARLRSVFEFFAFLVFWREERKTVLQKTVFALNLLGREIAKRSSLSWTKTAECLPYEIYTIPLSGRLIAKNQQRLKRSYYMLFWPKQKHVSYLPLPDCKKLDKIFFSPDKLSILKGQGASPGVVRGKVNIIKHELDFKKFKAGEILVTAMTRPEFMPILRKAAAIVTDEGGITCHAAIVSRELNIPCIIGTQKATQVLKNGDLVEVNANNGIVKKL